MTDGNPSSTPTVEKPSIAVSTGSFASTNSSAKLEQQNWYQILGVPHNASQQEIRRAYRRIAMNYAPDDYARDQEVQKAIQEPAQGASNRYHRFVLVTQAYLGLSDKDMRKKYDDANMDEPEAVKTFSSEQAAKLACDPYDVWNADLGFYWNIAPNSVAVKTLGLDASQCGSKKTMWENKIASIQDVTFEAYRQSYLTGWGRKECQALSAALSSEREAASHAPTITSPTSPIESGPTQAPVGRVIVVRHGMGYHNDAYGAGSHFARDAELNPIGIQQAQLTGDLLRSTTNLFDVLDLIVVSPFTRTLQTALNVVGKDEFSKYPTIVQPLCAEHTLSFSVVQQGDRGSTSDQLRERFPQSEYPFFKNFVEVDQYCSKANGMDGGKWWHHSAVNTSESRPQFKDRAANFRAWLGHECMQRSIENKNGDMFHVLVVSHGGLLVEAFGEPKYENCEVRVFDIYRDGAYTRISTGEKREAPTAAQAGALNSTEERPPILLSVNQVSKEGQNYVLEGTMDQCSMDNLPWAFKFKATVPWSKLDRLHQDLRALLTSAQYSKYLGDGSWPGTTTLWVSEKLTSWLRRLKVAMTDQAFPRPCEEAVAKFFAPYLTEVMQADPVN